MSGKLKAVDIDTKVDKPLQYLGFIYNGQEILIRSSSLSNYYRRLISKIRASKNKAGRNNSKTYRRKIYRMYIVKLLYYSYRIRKKLEITHRLSRSTILYAYV